MAVIIFLKILSDAALLSTAFSPLAIHFGGNLLTCIIATLVICLAETASYLICSKWPERTILRLLPLLFPFICLLIPGMSVSCAVLEGFILAYAIFVSASKRYMPDPAVTKTMFKISIGALVLMAIILLLAGASGDSYQATAIFALIAISSNVLLLRSLRHEEQVYSTFSFQALNISIILVVCAAAVVVSTKAFREGILSVLKTVYNLLAYAIFYVIYAFAWLFNIIASWIGSLSCAGSNDAEAETQAIEIHIDTAEDLLGEVNETAGIAPWVKILFIVIAALIVLAIIVFIFRRLAGDKVNFSREKQAGKAASSVTDAPAAQRRAHSKNSQAQGVRKQYLKYMNLLANHGQEIRSCDTTEDIERNSAVRSDAQEQLRQLYLQARYNDVADKAAEAKAKELLKQIKSTM